MSLTRIDILTESETEYLCRLVSPKEIKLYFQKKDKIYATLKTGYRAMSLTDQKATELIVKNRNKNFVAEFFTPFISAYQKEVHDHIDLLKEAGIAADAALIRALVDSKVFSGYVELYFKFENDPVSDEYVSLINTAVALLRERTTESAALESSYAELSQSLEDAQRKLMDEREEHEHIQAKIIDDSLAMQEELKYAKDELAKAVSKIELTQSELDHYEWLMKYAAPPYENEDSGKYQHTSLCRVVLNNFNGKTQLERLADIHDDELELFQMDKTLPLKFENRKWLYMKNDSSIIGSWGIWH